MATETLTLGQAAKRLGVDLWQLQRGIERGLVTHYRHVGRYRVIDTTDLPAVAEELRTAGYRAAEVPAHA